MESCVSLGTPIIVRFSFLEQQGPDFLPLHDAWAGLTYFSKKPSLFYQGTVLETSGHWGHRIPF